MDLDKFDVKDDNTVRQLCKGIARLLSFDANDIPLTLEDCERIKKENGIHFVLQLLFHSIGHAVKDSPHLAGIERMQACGKSIFPRVIESGFQELYKENLDSKASVHELLHFDMKGLKDHNERASLFYQKVLNGLLKFLNGLGLDDEAQKKLLMDTATERHHYFGSWPPGGINKLSAATPLIAKMMTMNGGFFENHDQHANQDYWFSNAYTKATDEKDPYKEPEKFYTDEEKEEAVNTIWLRILFLEENGGIQVMDTNEMAFDGSTNEGSSSSIKDYMLNVRGWTLITDIGNLQLHANFNNERNVLAIVGITRPLCWMINPEVSLKDSHAEMTERAICNEAFRLLVASCLDNCQDQRQDELFKGNIVIAHRVSMYFCKTLKMNRRTGSLLFKQVLTPLNFNVFDPKCQCLSGDTSQWSTHARCLIRRASNERTRTDDRLLFRKIVQIALCPTGTIATRVDKAMDYMRKGTKSKTVYTRNQTILTDGANQLFRFDVLQAFRDALGIRTNSKGNCTSHGGKDTEKSEKS